MSSMISVRYRRPKVKGMPKPRGLTNDHRLMIVSGSVMRYLDELIYTREEAIAVSVTFNRANRRQSCLILQQGEPTTRTEIGIDGDVAAERTVELREMRVIQPTDQEIRDFDLNRKVHARLRRRA